ncbi:bifunctional 3-(3-hydroxy-phenyl)propionate/3-hydroxycinnamic acid hydroxylase [Nocardioides sp. W7]|uniref:bifunctional 3-(3-hydroxy-phenyl)propionate/3-hydroxycinnamic acid hydroxylase MhpA n=1 Tax=Nocardioides sp. W7 TaxID=2931390 RepID=UPI001FD18418|nr:bifunctional 3-(3-hydroxy-phenyl)propionate/3-hydroxycinnamic acid hydroxylase [Nocardioides sp. W7]
MSAAVDTDVLIIGAGPVGLMTANLLGVRGRSAIVLEARSELIDYPRGVGLDDESLRTIQTAGLLEEIRPYTVPQHISRMVNGKGQVLVTNDPRTDEFGFPRKHGFNQPLVDRELASGLDRFEDVELRFCHEGVDIVDEGDHVRVVARVVREGEPATTVELTARYVVGCEGGRSLTRTWMGVDFEGRSPSTRWLVIDVDNDPLGTPNVYLGADPRRPYVSIGLPHGIRRWEFMLFEDEPTELVESPEFMHRLLEPHVPDPTTLDVIGQRVFTHHGRIASSFRKGRVLLAGDAAHLMPVWLGQGWNSGVRDATNLAWKLSAVLSGLSDDRLLDTYDEERRQHAADMIEINMYAGALMKCGPVAARVRDTVAGALNAVPSLKSWFTDMRFKPMPRYAAGVVVDQSSRTPGSSALRLTRRIAPFVDAPGSTSPVGRQFIQPRVNTCAGTGVLLDDVVGHGWTILAWGNDPTRHLSDADLAAAQRLGIHLVAVFSETQREWAEKRYADSPVPVSIVGDVDGRLKTWFDTRACGVVFLRPDRFVAAACLAQETSPTLRAVLDAASYQPSRAPEGAVR